MQTHTHTQHIEALEQRRAQARGWSQEWRGRCETEGDGKWGNVDAVREAVGMGVH